MPRRIWIQAGLIVGLLLVAFVAITAFVPRSDTTDSGTRTAQNQTTATSSTGANRSSGASQAAAPPPVDPTLVSDIVAFVVTRSAGLPASVAEAGWLPVDLVSITTDGSAGIKFDYRVGLDRNNFDGPSPGRELVPGFVAAQNTAFTGFSFTDAYVAAVCTDVALASLIARGAVATFTYYDSSDRQLAFLPVRRCI